MAKKKIQEEIDPVVQSVIEGIQELKGKSIVTIDLRNVKNTICDFFIICEGDSNTHVASIADSVERFVYLKNSEKPRHVEGRENAHWVLIDFFNVVVHVFQKEYRDFYKLEDLWSDGKMEQIQD